MTKEAEFKSRLAAVLSDLQSEGRHDGEAMLLLGGGAARLCDLGRKQRWSELKASLTADDFRRLIEQCRVEGNAAAAAGRAKSAYAIQAIALSLVAHSQADRDVRTGEHLLDALIDQAVANYRQRAPIPKTN